MGRGWRGNLLAVLIAAIPLDGFAAAPGLALDDVISAATGTTRFQEAALSPDAKYVAWVQAVPTSPGSDIEGAAIYVAEIKTVAAARRVTATPGAPPTSSELNVAWSPDSAALAFVSDAASPGQRQLYVYRYSDRSVRRLTDIKGFIGTPAWSPDGRTLSVLYTENSPRAAGPLTAVAAEVGVVGETIYEQRIAIIDTAGGLLRAVSPAGLYVYEYDWSPDGRRFIVTAAHGAGDNNWYVAELMSIDRDSGETRSLLKPSIQIAVPRWSPDGRRIAFIGGLMSDEGIASGDAYVIDSGGGEPHNLSEGREASVYWLAWRADSRSILLAEAVDGGSGLAEVDAMAGRVKPLWRGAETLRGPADLARGISVARDGVTTLAIRESFTDVPALWHGRVGAWQRLLAPAGSGPRPWGATENVHWQSDEFMVQGWLVAPPVVDATRRYPLVVWVHGGPAWLSAPAWPTLNMDYAALIAARGYYVLFPNPRGSAGYGERFKRANVKDFGGGDLRDILNGVARVVRTHPIDGTRVGITGWSYGGYMTMWALTQTDRFRAGVVGAGLSDWLSYYGENGIDEWMLPYFGASVYDDPAVYAKSSPINFVKQVRAPTLLLVGDSDVECPPSQSYEYWHALRTFQVKSELVIYPHEGHGFVGPDHMRDRLQRTIQWFDDYMPESGAASQGH
jgi:dipeptidyl aminopeptidase/acylaminoacyl peptidase